MDITESMVLPDDLLFIPLGEPADHAFQQYAERDDDVILTRLRSRTKSRVVNRETAELLQLFRQPRTIVEAVLILCVTKKTDVNVTLEQVYRTLCPFLQSNWLVPARSADVHGIEATLHTGDVINDYKIVSCIQLLEDTEVYQVRSKNGSTAALKITRRGASDELKRILKHEAHILTHLNGWPAPKLLDTGSWEGECYLVMTWCSGVPLVRAAAELGHRHLMGVRRRSLNLARSILRAYVVLNEKGVVHGDLSLRNILVDANGTVTIVDYGCARLHSDTNGTLDVPRNAVPEYYEPELAAAALARAKRPAPSLPGEEYALAALVYFLVTGEHYLIFSPFREEMLRQIVESPPLDFSDHGLPPWPMLEAILHKALQKDPALRFASSTDFMRSLDALDAIEVKEEMFAPVCSHGTLASARKLVAQLGIANVRDFQLQPELPHCSITYGAAGIAYAMYCVACARGDSELLSCADAWAIRAALGVDKPDAFTSDQLSLDDSMIGRTSVYYGRPGVHLVQSLIANAMGDEASLMEALKCYVDTCREPSECFDLTLGKAGIMGGTALLLSAINTHKLSSLDNSPVSELRNLGNSTLSNMWAPSGIQLMTEAFRSPNYLGIAHGWAGIVYASLLWSETCDISPPKEVLDKLEQLAELAQEHGRGLRWPIKFDGNLRISGGGYMESWCHGAPGYILLWTAAFRVYREPRFLRIAERAGWTAWDDSGNSGSLCCGHAGRAYALLNLFRHTSDREWLSRAIELAERAFVSCERDGRMRYSLFKGALGAAVLLEDLNEPARASFPLFERELRGTDVAPRGPLPENGTVNLMNRHK
jgi:serine/threonine-protein kinase